MRLSEDRISWISRLIVKGLTGEGLVELLQPEEKLYREVKKAITEFVKALRINPCHTDAVVNLGDVLMRIKEDPRTHLLSKPWGRSIYRSWINQRQSA